jgi:hypothetical protein
VGSFTPTAYHTIVDNCLATIEDSGHAITLWPPKWRAADAEGINRRNSRVSLRLFKPEEAVLGKDRRERN